MHTIQVQAENMPGRRLTALPHIERRPTVLVQQLQRRARLQQSHRDFKMRKSRELENLQRPQESVSIRHLGSWVIGLICARLLLRTSCRRVAAGSSSKREDLRFRLFLGFGDFGLRFRFFFLVLGLLCCFSFSGAAALRAGSAVFWGAFFWGTSLSGMLEKHTLAPLATRCITCDASPSLTCMRRSHSKGCGACSEHESARYRINGCGACSP